MNDKRETKPKRKAMSFRLPAETARQFTKIELITGYTQTQILILAMQQFYRDYQGFERNPEQPPVE